MAPNFRSCFVNYTSVILLETLVATSKVTLSKLSLSNTFTIAFAQLLLRPNHYHLRVNVLIMILQDHYVPPEAKFLLVHERGAR